VWSIYRAGLNPENDFSPLDLLMEHGRASRTGCVFMGAFGVMSWAIVQLAAHDKLTEGYLGLYAAAFVTPIVARMFSTAPAAETKP
jgi:hypothetical protein